MWYNNLYTIKGQKEQTVKMKKYKKINIQNLLVYYAIPIFMIAIIIASITNNAHMPRQINIFGCLFGIVSMIFSFFLLRSTKDKDHDDKKTEAFAELVFSVFIGCFLTILTYTLSEDFDTSPIIVHLIYYLNDIVGFMDCALFWNYLVFFLKPNKMIAIVNKFFVILFTLVPIIYFVNYYTGIIFRVNRYGLIEHTLLSMYIYFISSNLILFAFAFMIIFYLNEPTYRFSLLSFSLFPTIYVFIVAIWGLMNLSDDIIFVLQDTSLVLSLFVIFFKVYERQRLEMKEKETQLTEARIDIMLSQIQPHFIYNSLTAIIGLVDEDPVEAKEAIVDFSDYLRINLDSLKSSKLVPFKKEIEHTQTYLSFELLRFEHINVDYKIETSDFLLPVLTVQPLVENAVRHGLSTRAEGGTVTISTKELENEFMITIEDNGIGFDQNIKEKETDDRQNVGIENVKQRLNDMCHGSLCIESKIGIGTKATILLPKEETKNENSSN